MAMVLFSLCLHTLRSLVSGIFFVSVAIFISIFISLQQDSMILFFNIPKNADSNFNMFTYDFIMILINNRKTTDMLGYLGIVLLKTISVIFL